MEGSVVSRRDIFGEGETAQPETSSPLTALYGFDFEEVEVNEPSTVNDITNQHQLDLPTNDEKNEEETPMDFQLFANDGIAHVNLIAKPDEARTGRPLAFYTYQPTPADRDSFVAAAVTGDFVRSEADFWRSIYSRNGPAPDINADYVPKKRKCRPGVKARQNKKLKNKRVEEEQKAQRGSFKRKRPAGRPHRFQNRQGFNKRNHQITIH